MNRGSLRIAGWGLGRAGIVVGRLAVRTRVVVVRRDLWLRLRLVVARRSSGSAVRMATGVEIVKKVLKVEAAGRTVLVARWLGEARWRSNYVVAGEEAREQLVDLRSPAGRIEACQKIVLVLKLLLLQGGSQRRLQVGVSSLYA